MVEWAEEKIGNPVNSEIQETKGYAANHVDIF